MMTDIELLSRLAALSKIQAEAESQIIEYLVEVERRNLHLKQAYRSLFEFVRDYLKCSDATAGRRVAVVRAAAKFPILLEYIRSEKLALTCIATIVPHLTAENHVAMLGKVEGLSTRTVEKMLAAASPTKAKRDIVRPISLRATVPTSVEVTPVTLSAESENEKFSETSFEGEALILSEDPVKNSMYEEKVRIAFDAPAKLAEKIERLKEIHGHKPKKGSFAEIIDMAVEMLLEKTAPERKEERAKEKAAAQVPRNLRQPKAPTGFKVETRRPVASLRREIWHRDESQCTYMDETGKRCSAKSHLHIDHIRPWALGGTSRDAENLRLLCAAHNGLMARKYFLQSETKATSTGNRKAPLDRSQNRSDH